MEISMTYHASEEVENSINTIIANAKQGDRQAFGQIFELHHRFIYKFIYAMLGKHEIAEELTQDTFLGAFKGISSLRGDSTLKTWLCGIAKNHVYQSFRSKRKEGEKVDDEFETLNLLDDKNPRPDKHFLNKELNQVIQIALGKLNEDRRLVFVLKEMQQFSYGEISEVTGSTIPKLKTDLFRAKSEMRMLLKPYLEVKNEL
jgi:RNA polymerase sigma-70 factor, ECF subfamily